jgi:hypothetical protein
MFYAKENLNPSVNPTKRQMNEATNINKSVTNARVFPGLTLCVILKDQAI